MIDDIVWGNPTQRSVAELEKKTIIDDLFEVFSEMPYPKNSSDAVKQELNQLVDYVSQLKQNETYIDRYRYYDYGLDRLFYKVCEQQGIDKETIKEGWCVFVLPFEIVNGYLNGNAFCQKFNFIAVLFSL